MIEDRCVFCNRLLNLNPNREEPFAWWHYICNSVICHDEAMEEADRRANE